MAYGDDENNKLIYFICVACNTNRPLTRARFDGLNDNIEVSQPSSKSLSNIHIGLVVRNHARTVQMILCG